MTAKKVRLTASDEAEFYGIRGLFVSDQVMSSRWVGLSWDVTLHKGDTTTFHIEAIIENIQRIYPGVTFEYLE